MGSPRSPAPRHRLLACAWSPARQPARRLSGARLWQRLRMSGLDLPVTLFGTPKAFRGHFAIIQKNAITSWTRLQPKVDVILFGNDSGTAEMAQELGIRHIGDIACNQSGAPRVDDLFAKAEDAVPHGLLCYVNADIMLMDDFPRAVRRLASLSPLMMIGRRWDTDITEPWDFQAKDWQARLQILVRTQGKQGTAGAIDYFLFSKGLGRNLLPLALGRTLWDHWLVWNARKQGAAIVDASDVVMAVHQNHDYSHHPADQLAVLLGFFAAPYPGSAGGMARRRSQAEPQAGRRFQPASHYRRCRLPPDARSDR